MSEIFAPSHRLQLWLEIELLVCEGWAQLGEIPSAALPRLRQATVDKAAVEALEEKVGHDVVAFVEVMAQSVGDEGRYLHRGLTSSDVLDTALAVQLVRALDVLDSDLQRLLSALRRRALEERRTLMVGRTHGVHAEPLSLGFVLAGWLDELERGRERLKAAREEVRVGKIAGAVGIHATVDPRVEAYALKTLELGVAPVATQVIARDRHAALLTSLAVLAGSLEKFATDVRLWQQTEVAEIREPFGREQKGSSAMPHKRNPVLSERICGLARTVRGYALVSLEDQALWHERDISHSSAERIVIPDAFMALDFMLRSMSDIVEGLAIDRDRMRKNLLHSGGVVFSQRVLLALVDRGVARPDAYRAVQKAALAALDGNGEFKALVQEDPLVRSHLEPAEVDALFDPAYYLRHVDLAFERLGLVKEQVEVRS